MITKINFAPAGTLENSEYILDTGLGYSLERGFGWVTQDSLNKDNPTPIDLSINTRDRDENDNCVDDSLIHLQYPAEFSNIEPLGNSTPGAWEYNLANGRYLVTVSVGDPQFTDSNHVINIEGNSVISGFVPTEDQLFTSTTTLIEITDGRLTIDAEGGFNTKLNFVEITSAEPININFGTAITATPAEFIQDIGQGFDSDRGYGWVTQDSLIAGVPQAIDLVTNVRDRHSGTDSLTDSLIHLQYPVAFSQYNASVATPAAWEYELANGQYEVTVSVGDTDFTDSNHVINIEGNSVISGFVPSAGELFTTATTTVEVTDGRLTVDAIGGENTKLNYISIVPVISDSV